jgi:hypothetical protein
MSQRKRKSDVYHFAANHKEREREREREKKKKVCFTL